MTATLGVGIIGAGPVTQAIHLPTLATLPDRFHVTRVMDIDPQVAATVAARARAQPTTQLEELLADTAVDVVAICSPHQFHADQVAAAAAAGKRAVLCEKPLATTVAEAARINEISQSTGMPVIVGAMHAYDPAWIAAKQHWGNLPQTARLVRSMILLPGNDEFVNLATDLAAIAARPPAPHPAEAPSTAQAAAGALRGGILGLATHAIPQVRQFLPAFETVAVATRLRPFGYRLVLTGGRCTVELVALMPGKWRPDWRLDVWGPASELHVRYPPSYVLAGSATAALTSGGGEQRWSYPMNGYQAEWAHLADVVDGLAEPAIPVQTAVDDLSFAATLADAAIETSLERA